MINPNPENSSARSQVRRITLISLYYSVVAIIFIVFFFQNGFIYCIIYFSGSVISILGFLTMSRIIDRYLKKGHNQALYFVVSLIRLVVISGGFYLAIRVARHAVIFYILGLLVTIAALFTEAVMQLFRRTATCKNIKS